MEVKFPITLLIFIFCQHLVRCEPLIDCYPESNPDESECIARGCVWNTSVSLVDEKAPWCTYPDGYGYEVSGDALETSLGFLLKLNRKNQPTIYGGDVQSVFLSVEFWSESILRLKFYDPINARYEVPIEITQPQSKAARTNFKVTYTNDPQFGISVIRNSTGTAIFNTGLPGYVFSDQFLSISTILPSANVYGFGENVHHALLHDLNWRDWTMFAAGNGPTDPYNMYGVQPFYMSLENDGNANGVFLLNSNALEIQFQPSQVLTYRTIGGILDFYLFLGPKPEDVVSQFTQVIGRPYMPPYWSLGFQLSRYGYQNTEDLRTVVENMRNAQIPYDVQYVDIDMMSNRWDFTVSPNFADISDVIDDLHSHGQHFVVILDAGIANSDANYTAFKKGMEYDIFIKFENGTILEGQHRPGNIYYPDFSHQNAVQYWAEQCLYLYQDLNVEYDGLWIDQNEPTNFAEGSTSGCEKSSWNYPPYVPNVLGSLNLRLFYDTICMDAVQSDNRRHYDVHSLYGHFMAKTTFNSLLDNFPSRRPFVLTRSQFSGTNRYAHHWSGDNGSLFEQLRISLISIQEYNMFGIPFVGADICGYGLDTTEELCMRWMQLGAFYPFSRNQNSDGSIPQDPPSLGPRVVNASIKALTERYRLLPYLYTLLYEAHTFGSTVARPLFHEFSSDANTWNISYQFMWGSGLLVSPVVYEGAETVDAYFPQANWYDYYTGKRVESGNKTLDAPLDGYIPLHVRGGNIIPTQQPSTTTTASRNNPMGLIVALDGQGKAEGQLYWDDGSTYDADVIGLFNVIQYSMDNNILNIVILNNGLQMDVPLDTVLVYGQEAPVTSANVDGSVLDPSQIDYNSTSQVLTLTNLNLNLPVNHQIQIY